MAQIVNNLYVRNTNSTAETQSCTFDISSPSWIFSYKSCEVENGVLSKGGDYAFTLTFGNMGECPGRTVIADTLRVTDIGGVQLRVMDYCGNCSGYTPLFFGLFYNPANDRYFVAFLSLEEIIEYNFELVILPYFPMNIFIYDNGFYIPLEPHTIECLGLLFQVEDIFCDNYSLFSDVKGVKERELLTDEDLQLPPKELDVKLKELKAKLNKDFKAIK